MIVYSARGARQPLPPPSPILQANDRKLVAQVESICDLTGTALSRFGRDVTGDPNLIFDMRRGREIRHETRVRIRILMHLNRLALDHARKVDARAAMARLDRASARGEAIHA